MDSDRLRIFFVTGNCGGQENQGLPAASHSDSRTLEGAAISLIIGSDGKLHAQDYFQSYDYQNMGGGDQDFDSGGLSLLDPTVLKGNGITRMALTSGKNGKIYISNADNLGGHRYGPCQTDIVLKMLTPIMRCSAVRDPILWIVDISIRRL